MTNWNSRLAVSYVDDSGTHLIAPIDSFTPTFALNAEPIHSIEQTHVGVVYTPQAITFTMTVRAIGEATAQLTSLAVKGQHFDIILQENEGDDWSFNSIVLTKCLITNAAPTAATISGAPTATFSGFSLGFTAEPKSGEGVGMEDRNGGEG
jgi:hypothetical protein